MAVVFQIAVVEANDSTTFVANQGCLHAAPADFADIGSLPMQSTSEANLFADVVVRADSVHVGAPSARIAPIAKAMPARCRPVSCSRQRTTPAPTVRTRLKAE